MPEPPPAAYPPQPEPLPEDGMPLPPPLPEPDVVAHPPPGDQNIGMVRDSVQTFVTSILNIVISLGSSIILSRTIAPIGKGLFAILILIPKSAWSFGTFGLDQVNTVYAGREPERRHELATTTLVLGILISFLVTGLVALALYWPGKGAARVGIQPGDFLTIGAAPVHAGPNPLLDPAGMPLQVSVVRDGIAFPKTIPYEEGAAERRQVGFRFSALNNWKYGLQGNPLYREQVYIPALGIGVLPLTREVMRDLEARRAAGHFSDDAIAVEPLESYLVTQVGEGGRFSRIRNLGKSASPFRIGDILILTANGTEYKFGLPRGHSQLTVVRDGTPFSIDWPAGDTAVEGARVPLVVPQELVRMWGLGKNLLWQEMTEIPRLGLSVVPITEERWADLQHRQRAGLFAEGVTLPAARPDYLVTQVGYAPLRNWSQDLPPALFMLTML
ncbi:MAG TPA: hypothetical protein VEI97_21070, partial [bacterium]|nr:hypothetical protein [bacterium]